MEKTLLEKLETADVILLLVSARFLASDYCYDIELQRAIDRHNAGKAHAIPVILKPCDWNNSYVPFICAFQLFQIRYCQGTVSKSPNDLTPRRKRLKYSPR